MALFSIINSKLTMLNTLPISKEKELQKLVENNLKEALDIHFLASEYRTTNGGRIDTLGVDSDGSPCIIEYKKNRDDNVINQSLSYLKWLKSQSKEFFEMLIHNQLGTLAKSIKLDWRNPRVICIAESFSRYDIDTIEVIPLKIDLYKFRYYENGMFSLNVINVKDQVNSNVLLPLPVETNLSIIEAMKNQVATSYAISATFDELRERILKLDENIFEKSGKRVVAYRLTISFVEILIRKDKLVIDLRPINYNDPRGMVERIAVKYLVTLNQRITLSDPADIDYVFGIIEQSYANVL